MAEDFSKSNPPSIGAGIEAEILELSQKIAEKRKQLEASKGIVEERSLDAARDRELVKSVLGEKINNSAPQSAAVAAVTASATAKPAVSNTIVPVGKSYLDFLDEESRTIVEALVEDVFTQGLDKTLKELSLQEPFIIDVFHDVLTDRIHDELKKRGII